ncbi:MAG: SDR family oxidoreductase [Pseudomonadota bacterium]
MKIKITELNNCSALVTGASQGIGLAIAQKLSHYGVSVCLAARNKQVLDAHVERLVIAGRSATAVACDVANYTDVQTAVDHTVKQFGKLDILINNAGIIEPISRIAESDPAAWSYAVDVNLKGVYHGLRAALPHMESRGCGVIVNMSSGAANSALEGWSHYCSTKAAVKKLTECAHAEMHSTGVRIVGLSPGTVATDMMHKIRSSGINPVSRLDWSTHIPAEWVGEAVAWLCGSDAKEFDGTDFSIKTEAGRRRAGLPTTLS